MRYPLNISRKFSALFPPKVRSYGRVLRDLSRPDSESRLIFIHIGKCGGASLLRAVDKSEIVRANFKYVERVHIRQPPILKRTKYLIVIRNPISRTISAFNWRRKIVVEAGQQKERFRGEYAVLLKYPTVNALAESLYVNDCLNRVAVEDFRKIHHLKEDISFYLEDLLNEIDPSQIFCVLTTEFLNVSIEEMLGVKAVQRRNENQAYTNSADLYVSEIGRSNLRRFLESDYAAIEKLLEFNPIPAERREAVLR